MNEELMEKIKAYVRQQHDELPYPRVAGDLIDNTELQLGFKLPALLRACYEQIANGGFGPGYGIIGVENGAKSDFGSLYETYAQLKSDQESVGNEWPSKLLPFCDWGCNIYSCVDCSNTNHQLYQFESFAVQPQGFDLCHFFELWIGGRDILAAGQRRQAAREAVNPFSGRVDVFKGRTGGTD